MPSVRWKQLSAVISATALLVASISSLEPVRLIPEGVPPPAGDDVPAIDISMHGRPADQLRFWATARASSLQIPVIALEAYAYAAKVAEIVNPRCHVEWPTLAGIGMVESHHGTYRGATLAPNGDVYPPIRGVPLDGSGGNLRIVATDLSTGEPQFTQAMGPMQFISATWQLYGVDAHNDGRANVDNIDDAALSAAGYLCNRGGDMATPSGWMTAIEAYDHSVLYARAVRDLATAYADGRSP